ncbi:Ig-like domain-containing protein [Pseudomonas atacamensis]|uniref:Ig-like domain-containing protein n=1 Tax=Pseudomonas atacamensis TaxID=2565368 RepID=UPI001C3C38D9|nr:Ig-like domain-containing protein [Pseudomonas atacamensis]QXH74834.1 Ig-like domain-containing protein [Pseudomonas atacamensis]
MCPLRRFDAAPLKLFAAAGKMQKFRPLAVVWLLSLVQVISPLLISLTPAMTFAGTPTTVSAAKNTVPYKLKNGETVFSIAKKHNLPVDELQALNQSRDFKAGFTKLGAGDELDVPHSLPSGIESASEVQLDIDNAAQRASALGGLLHNKNPSDAASDMVRSTVLNQANLKAEQWLGQYGTARVQVNVGNNSDMSGSDLDWLLPFYDDSKNLVFTQVGVRNQDERTIGNLGVGVRKTMGEWLYGANAFYDYDMTGKNRRFGLGGEVWTDNLKLSANSYLGVSDWHQSRDFKDYDERPANGFDIRGEAFLPSHPQLGGTLKYEQYFGNEVALFGKDDRTKDPKAFTVGLNYTPIPLLTLGVEHRTGSGGNNENSANLHFTFRPGNSWKSHIDPQAVSASRSLAGSRYDLVERNNNIVLEYKKHEQAHVRLSLPPEVTGPSGSTQLIQAEVEATNSISRMDWDASAVIAAGGTVSQISHTTLAITLPRHQISGVNQYPVSLVAIDSRGTMSNRVATLVNVTPALKMALTVLSDNADSNGTDRNRVSVQVSDENGEAIPGQSVVFTADNGATVLSPEVLTNDSGTALTDLTSMTLGVSTVSVTTNNHTESISTTFGPRVASADIAAFHVLVDNAVSDGIANNQVQALVADSQSAPIANQTVTFSIESGQATLATDNAQTDAAGLVSATLTSTVAGSVTVKAKLHNGKSRNLDTNFTADISSATITAGNLTVLEDYAVANGVAFNKVQVLVTDANGNPVPNHAVTFSATNNALVTSAGSTDAAGVLIATLTNTTVGLSEVKASVNGSNQTVNTTFTANPSNASISNLTVIDDLAFADGRATNSVQALVTDPNNNPVPNEMVIFGASNGAVLISTGMTNADGLATATLTNTVAGDSAVTATINASTQTVNVTFTADAATADIRGGDLTVLVNDAVANGMATNRVQARVSDSQNNPVRNQRVTFSAVSGGVTVVTSEVTTDEHGLAVTDLTNTLAGTSRIQASLSNGRIRQVDLNFVADGSTATITATNLRVLDDYSVANGMDSNSVSVTVTDVNDNPVPGQAVAFIATNSATIISTNTTNAAGVVIARLTNTNAGISAVTASVNGQSQTKDTTFIAGGSDSGSLTVLSNDAVADGVATNRVQAKVVDSNNNPVPNQAVTFSVISGSATVVTASVSTDSNGLAVTDLTSTVAGSSEVRGTLAGGAQRQVTVNFIADDSTAIITASNLTVINDNAVANDAATNRVQALVTDGQGNPVPNKSVIFAASNGATTLSLGMTDAAGKVFVTLTNQVAGISTVTATVNGIGRSVDTNFVADASTATITATNLRVLVDNSIANGAATNQVRALVTDANNNPVANHSVTFVAGNGAIITAAGMTDGTGGVTATLTNRTAGVSAVMATVNGTERKVDTTFVADGSTAVITGLTVENDFALANGRASNSVQALVTDAYNNPVPNQMVMFDASNGATIFSTGLTGADGRATAALTNTVIGASVVTVRINASTHAVNTTFIADAATADIRGGDLTVLVNDAVANGMATNRVQARVSDSQNNPVRNQRVTFSAVSGGVTVVTSEVTTDEHGLAVTDLTNTLAGTSRIQASLSNGRIRQVDLNFVADGSTATITATNLRVLDDYSVANGMDSNSVSVTVTDVNDNPVPGQAVAFIATNSATIISTNTTNAAGVVIARLTNTNAGISAVTASVNGQSQTKDTTFIAGGSDSGSLTVLSNDAVADGVATNRVQAKVVDSNNNPVPNQAVTFSVISGSATVVTASVSTDSNGLAVTDLTSTVAGSSEVRGTLAGGAQRQVTVNFIADDSTAIITASNLTVINDNAVANDAATNRVQALVTDGQGNPVPNKSVIFAASNGATTLSLGMTDAAGKVFVTLTNQVAGISTVTATVNGIGRSVDTNFVADASTATITATNLTVLENNSVANGVAANRVQALVTDANNNPVANQTVMFTASNGANDISTGMTNAVGIVVVVLTNRTAGISKVTATVNGSGRSVDTNFVADASTATITATNLRVLVDNSIANGAATNQVRALVTDANNNPVANHSVTFVAGNGAIITAAGMTDGTGGVTATLTNRTAGVSAVMATVNGTERKVDTTFVADGSTAVITGLTVENDFALANGRASNSVQALVTDAYNNPVPNQMVMFDASNGATIFSTGLTGADGRATAALTNTVIGASVVTVRINASTHAVNTTFIADAATADIRGGDLTVLVNDAVANGMATNRVQARVSDSQNNPVRNQRVTFSAVSGGVTVVTSEVTTDEHGLAVTDLTNTLAGTSRIQASLSNGRNNEVDVNFRADASTAAIVSMLVLDSNAVADGTSDINVITYVQDMYGNPVPSHQITFTAINGASVDAPGMTNANGFVLASVTSTTAGDITITASLSNGSSMNAIASFIAGGSDSGSLTVLVDNAVANGIATNRVQARILDSHNNPVSNQEINFSVVSGAAAVVTATVNTDGNGLAITDLTSSIAGSSEIRATLGGVQYRQVTINFIADSSTARVDLTVQDNNAVANGVATNEVRATVTDANGNPLPNQAITFAAGNGATLHSLGVTDATGAVIANLTNTSAGISTVTATVNGLDKIVDTTFVSDVSTATIAATNLTVLVDNSVADGVAKNQVRALVTDAFDNPVPNQTVTFSASNGALIDLSSTSNANGEVFANLTNTAAGVSTVLATLNGSSVPVNTRFVAGVPDPLNSSMVATPSSIMANDLELSVLRFTVKDSNGNSVTGLANDIRFVVAGVAGTTLGNVVESPFGSGSYEASLKGTTEGAATVTPTITGSQLGAINVQVTFTVPWTSLTVSPSTAYVLPNQVEQFTATAVRNGASVDVTEQVMWTSSDQATATVADAVGTKGRVTGVTGGTADITASYGGLSSSGALTVSTVTLSQVFGQARAGDTSKLYQVGSDNQLAFRCGDIVDAMGTPAQGLVGGVGGTSRTASVNNVTSVEVEWGNWAGNAGGVSISKLTLRYSGGAPAFVCGGSVGVSAIQRGTWTVPAGSRFMGFNVSARTYVHEMQFTSLSNPL